MNIELTKTEKIKNYILIKFEGVCGIGSGGNSDSDFIIEKTKEEIQKDNSIQGVIFDFKDLRYSFGNRFANLFSSNSFKNNKVVFIRLIPNKKDLESWKSLIEDCTNLTINQIISENVTDSIKSINSQMNKK